MNYLKLTFKYTDDNGKSKETWECHPMTNVKSWFTFDKGKTWCVEFKSGYTVEDIDKIEIMDGKK